MPDFLLLLLSKEEKTPLEELYNIFKFRIVIISLSIIVYYKKEEKFICGYFKTEI